MQLEGSVAFVTGAGRALGERFVRALESFRREFETHVVGTPAMSRALRALTGEGRPQGVGDRPLGRLRRGVPRADRDGHPGQQGEDVDDGAAAVTSERKCWATTSAGGSRRPCRKGPPRCTPVARRAVPCPMRDRAAARVRDRAVPRTDAGGTHGERRLSPP